MSACGVILPSQDLPQTVEAVATSGEVNCNDEEKEESETIVKKKIISYTQEELLDLRTTPASVRKPEALAEEFYTKNGIWDPGAWHKSLNSRSSSPVADGRPVGDTKKADIFGDSIDLTPQRRSFHEGCHVQNKSDGPQSEPKLSFIKQLKGDALSMSEGKGRLTGRAAGQRKSFEKAYFKDRDVESNDRKPPKLDRDQEGRKVIKKDRDGKRAEKTSLKHCDSESSLPEWAIDGPTSQSDTIELKGFDDDVDRRDTVRKRTSTPRTSSKETDAEGRSSTSTTSSSKKSSLDGITSSIKEDRKPKDGEHERAGSRKSTPVDNLFDFNDVLSLLDLVPADMFVEDDAAGKSRFSKWFQRSRSNSHGSGSSGSRPGSVPLFQDQAAAAAAFARAMTPENAAGLLPNSYFTPIQPAPPCTVPSPEVPSLMEILQKAKNASVAAKPQPVKEIRGRMTVDDIEPPKTEDPATAAGTAEESNASSKEGNGQSAFERLVLTMKKSGQLPEKPAPVVTGLPDHLLPKPPRKTSPTFEKLKRQLSRSPSPLSFMNKSCPPVVQQTGLLTPEFFKQSLIPKAMPPSEFFKHTQSSERTPSHHVVVDEVPNPTENRFPSSENDKDVPAQPLPKPVAKVPTAFLPTSVMKKMHNEKLEREPVVKTDASFPRAVGQPIGSGKHQDGAFTEQLQRACELPFSSASSSRDSLTSIFSSPRSDRAWQDPSVDRGFLHNESNSKNVNDIFSRVVQPLMHHQTPFSAPNTPATRTGAITSNIGAQSAPGTPHRDSAMDPPVIQRLLNNSAFTPPDLSRDGNKNTPSFSSGTYTRFQNTFHSDVSHSTASDPRSSQFTREKFDAIPNNTSSLSIHNTDNYGLENGVEAPVRHITSLFHDSSERKERTLDTSRVSQTGSPIANQSVNDNSAESVPKPFEDGTDRRRRTPTPNSIGAKQVHGPSDTTIITKHGPVNNTNKKNLGPSTFSSHRNANAPRKRISPPIPVPLQQIPHSGGIPQNLMMNRTPGISNASAAIAAQALVQQHMMAQAARAQVLQAAQLYQQQQQQQALRAQMQAAIMAQTIARNKAMMYNPRSMMMYPPVAASPTHLRGQHNQLNRPIIPPLLQQNQQQQQQPQQQYMYKNAQPSQQHPGKERPTKPGSGSVEAGVSDSPLAKWFGKDILKTPKQGPTVDPSTKAKMICVEEIEQMQ